MYLRGFEGLEDARWVWGEKVVVAGEIAGMLKRDLGMSKDARVGLYSGGSC